MQIKKISIEFSCPKTGKRIDLTEGGGCFFLGLADGGQKKFPQVNIIFRKICKHLIGLDTIGADGRLQGVYCSCCDDE